MNIIYTDTHLHHNPPGEFVCDGLYPYSEAPARAEAILKTLQQEGYTEIVPPRDYSFDLLRAVHDADYLRYLENIYPAWEEASRPQSGVIPETFALRTLHTRPTRLLKQAGYYCFDAQTPIVSQTHTAAVAAARCALTGADQLLGGATSVYALCRPPGHHAGRALYGGYCYLNNAAIAAAYLSQQAPVAVLDIDYHHGNGTQDIFYDSDRVLFISIHADPNRAYPFFSGYADERGAGTGAGFNHNFPLPPRVDDDHYLQVLDRALETVRIFGPGFLVLSAGLDIYREDPLGDFDISLEAFTRIGEHITGTGLPVLLVQEGGYNIQQLGHAVSNLLSGFE